MILTRCPGDRPVAARAIAAASNAVAENAKYTQRQRLPSIKATMRSVRRRAGGMMKNAVVAAIGQGDEVRLRPLEQKIRSQSKIEEGDEERDHAHHHARHQERQYRSGFGFHDRAPLISSAPSGIDTS
jgi:hypothetical protein